MIEFKESHRPSDGAIIARLGQADIEQPNIDFNRTWFTDIYFDGKCIASIHHGHCLPSTLQKQLAFIDGALASGVATIRPTLDEQLRVAAE